MNYQAFLIKYAEIGIKGKNRILFEEALVRQIARSLKPVEGEFEVTREMGRIYVRVDGSFDFEGAVDAMRHVFGISGICPVVIVEDEGFEALAQAVVRYTTEVYPEGRAKTFKIFARRSNKSYPRDSMQLNADLGEAVLNGCPWMQVDVHHPDCVVTVEVRKHEKCKHLVIGGRSYAVVVLEAEGIVRSAEELTGIGLSSSGEERKADFVTDGKNDMDVEAFAPFSDTLSVYNECYVGHDLYFAKGGSRVTLHFNVGHRDRSLFLTRQEEEAELRVIKKKPKMILSDIPAEAFADEICMEYYNGLGWKKLPVDMDVSGLLGGAGTGNISLSFLCPTDWAKIQVGAYFGRTVRLRLIRSDNCYLRPGIHHYPVIEHFRAEFTYEGHFVDPDRLYRVAGTEKKEITGQLKTGKRFMAMSGGSYQDDALYLGFNNRMENGPVSLYFELEDQLNMNSLKCRFEYSTAEGFRPFAGGHAQHIPGEPEPLLAPDPKIQCAG